MENKVNEIKECGQTVFMSFSPATIFKGYSIFKSAGEGNWIFVRLLTNAI